MLSRVCKLLGFKSASFKDADKNYIMDQGDTVPPDAVAGYAVGALFLHRDGGEGTALYVNEGSESSCDFNAVAALTATQEALIGATAGTAAASKAVILDASKDIAGMNRITQGAFASLLQGSGSPLAAATPFVLGVYADDAGASIADSVRTILARTLLTVDQAGASIRSVMGQLKLATTVDVQTGIYTGVQGYVELAGTHNAKTGSTFSCFDASIEIGTSLTVDSGGEFAGLHVETTGAGTITNSGTCAGILIDKASGAASWPDGILIDGPSVIMGMRIGKFAGSAATTSAVLFATTQNIYSDGQASVFEVHGASSADLGTGYSAKCGRFRHVVNCTAAAHEVYGDMGQLVVKATTLTHLGAGVIGTFEGHTSGVVLNSTYTMGGHAAVMARVGGHAAITATTPLAGFSAFNNQSGALGGGTICAAFAASALSASYPWTHAIYVPSGSASQVIDAACTVSNTGRLAKLAGSVALPNLGDGYGFIEEQIDISGVVAGQTAAASTWINLGAAANGGSHTISVRDDGIWAHADATISSTKFIIGGRYQFVVDDGGSPGSLFLWATNIFSNVLTALIDVNTIVDFGGSSGAGSSGGYKIPFCKERSTGTVYYMNLYTS